VSGTAGEGPAVELTEEQAETIAGAVQAGSDAIAVPADLLVEPERKGADPGPPKTLYAQIAVMAMGEKIKLALRGNKDARTILVRDANRLIRRFVLLNPRISDTEVIAVARNRNADDELLRVISERREWMRNYQIRLALATNPKTPLALALKQVPGLGDRDLRQLGRSKNVPEAVAAQARRLILARTPGAR
jgi:hypothetical protein